MTSTNGLSRYSFVDVMAFGFKSSEWEDNAWVLGCYRLICFDWLLGSHLESCQNTDLALEAVNKILKSDHSNESFSEAFRGATGLSPVLKQKLCRHVLLSVCHYHPWIRMYRGGGENESYSALDFGLQGSTPLNLPREYIFSQ